MPRKNTTGKYYDEGEVETLWRKLREASACAEPLSAVVRQLPLKRSPEVLLHPDIGLGAQLRWCLARTALQAPSDVSRGASHKYSDEEIREHIRLGPDFFQLNTTNSGASVEDVKATASRIRKLAKQAQDPEKIQLLCELLSKRFGDDYRQRLGTSVMPADLFLVPVQGAGACRAFLHFLRTGEVPLADNGTLVAEVDYLPSAARNVEFKTLLTRLSTDSDRPIQGVAMPGSPSGQCAVAHELMRRLQLRGDETRPVVLLPCGRQFRNSHYCGLDFLVHNLLAFLERRPLTHEVPSLSTDQLHAAINRVRRHIARRPIIVVLVGYEVTRRSQPSLRRAIRDEPLAQLLPYVVHPDAGEADAPTDILAFRQTRWVVFADEKLDMLQPYREADIDMPDPTPEQLGDIVGMFTSIPRHARRLEDMLKASPLMLSEAKVCTAMQLLTLDKGIAERPASLVELVESGGSALLTRFAELVHLNPEPMEAAALHLLALAGSGLRYTTLWQCLSQWAHMGHPLSGQAEKRLPALADAVDWFERLLLKYDLVVYHGVDEHEPALDPTTHPFEYVDTTLASGLQQALDDRSRKQSGKPYVHMSLDFRFVELRETLNEHMRKNRPAWYLRSLHRVIAVEALRQYGLLVRHEPPTSRMALRDERRALEGIYHGLLSLPPRSEIASQPISSESDTSEASLPADPLETFQFLRDGVFGTLLEREDQYRMSREWAADDIKLDILELFHQAFAEPSTAPRGFKDVPAWRSDALIHQPDDLFRRHIDSVAAAAYGANDGSRWDQFESMTARSAPPDGDTFRLDRNRFDMEMLRNGPLSESTVRLVESPLKEVGVDWISFDDCPWTEADTNARLVPSSTRLEKYLQECAEAVRAVDSDRWGQIPAWLLRLAELRYQLSQLRRIDPIQRWRRSMECFALTQVASRLRTTSNRFKVLATIPQLSPRGARLLARSSLDLVRILPPAHATSPELREYLAVQARRALDVAVLTTGHHATDCVGLLILESRYARVVGAYGPHRERRHRIALEFLKEAESRLLPMRTRHRLWLRFLIEHCSVLRGLARDAADAARDQQRAGRSAERDLAVARQLLELARADVVQLERIVASTYPPHAAESESMQALAWAWQSAAEQQRARTDKASQEIAAVSVRARHLDSSSALQSRG